MPVQTSPLYAIQARLGNPVEWTPSDSTCFGGHKPAVANAEETGA